MKLVETADVFLTNYLPQRAQEAPDRRRRHPGPQPAHHHRPRLGHGPKGPEAHKGGYDGATFWAARAASGNAMPSARNGWPPGSQPGASAT